MSGGRQKEERSWRTKSKTSCPICTTFSSHAYALLIILLNEVLQVVIRTIFGISALFVTIAERELSGVPNRTPFNSPAHP
jgi:hypothetical protein